MRLIEESKKPKKNIGDSVLVFEILAIEILAGKCSLLIVHSLIIDQLKFAKTIKK